MSPIEYDLNPVTRITTGVIGTPGKRVFYLQARKDEQLVTLIVEKQQIQALAIGVEQFLADLQRRFPNLVEASVEYEPEQMELGSPIDPAFRVGHLGLGYDEASDRLVLVAREIEAEGDDPEKAVVARFWATRSQVRAFCRWGLELVNQGRPICGNCGEPIDPEGHFCPKRNGHKH
ncbi:MAG: DUF3090 domain-containing protein [Anaerolineales bacterium]|nr:DUF3090 domain-containing protein [Anaerolineales bacterium]